MGEPLLFGASNRLLVRQLSSLAVPQPWHPSPAFVRCNLIGVCCTALMVGPSMVDRVSVRCRHVFDGDGAYRINIGHLPFGPVSEPSRAEPDPIRVLMLIQSAFLAFALDSPWTREHP